MNYRSKSVDTSKNACLGRARAAEWRRAYPQNTLAHLQRDLDISKGAAESLLAGQFSSTSLGKIIMAYGPAWVAERVCEAAGSSLEQQLQINIADARVAEAKAREKTRAAETLLATYKAGARLRAGGLGHDAD